MKEHKHLFMPIVSDYDEKIGKWGIFDKKGNVIVPYVFDEILSSSDDFNYTHYTMEGIKVQMNLCPLPLSKFPPMPENLDSILETEVIPVFIRVYKQMVFTFVFYLEDDCQETMTDFIYKIISAKQHFVEAINEIGGCKYMMEKIPQYILEDIPNTIGRVVTHNITGRELMNNELYVLNSTQNRIKEYIDFIETSYNEAQEKYNQLKEGNNVDTTSKLYKEALESRINHYQTTDMEHIQWLNEALEIIKWLKRTCAFRMTGTNCLDIKD